MNTDPKIQETREGPEPGQFRSFPSSLFTFLELPTLCLPTSQTCACPLAAHTASFEMLRK